MEIYFIYLFIIIISGIFINKYNADSKSRLILNIIYSVSLFAISGLRKETVGKDLWNYLAIFYRYKSLSWSELTQLYEPGLFFLNKVIGMFTVNKQIYIALTSMFVLVGPIKLINKYSKNPAMSFFLYVTMTFFAFTMSGIRYAIGMSILLFTYDYIVEQKPIKFIIAVLIAVLFHKSLIIYLVAYPISHIKLTSKNMALYFMSFVIIFVVKRPLLRYFVTKFFDKYEYSLVTSLSVNYLFFMCIVFFVGYLFYKNVVRENYNSITLYNMILLAIITQLFALESNNIVRVAQLFYMYVILFIPEVISAIKDRQLRVIGNVIVYVATLIMYIAIFKGGGYGTVPYAFYWQ